MDRKEILNRLHNFQCLLGYIANDDTHKKLVRSIQEQIETLKNKL